MFQSLIDVILPVFLVIGAGYGTTRAGFFTQIHIDGLMKFAQGFAIPCLLFSAMARLDLETGFDIRLLLSFYSGAGICFALGIAAARLVFKRNWPDSVVIGFCCLFSNSVLLGLAITERAYGADNLTGNFTIIALHSPFCYFLGITVMEVVRNSDKGGLRTVGAILSAMFKNTLILAIAAGFAVNLTQTNIPGVIDEALTMITRTALPMALFSLGGALVQYRPEGDLRAILFVCAVSLLLHPAIVWTFGSAAGLPQDLFRSGVVTAAMAPGMNAFIFANMYGAAKRVAATSVLFSTGFCIFTAWFWLTLLG